MWTRFARLFVIKTKFEAFLVIYGLGLGAVERGVHYLEQYPGYGGWLLFAFIGTGSSFLAFAALAARHQIANPGYAHKSLYYLGGLTEGTETILLFVLGCLFPAHFAWLAWLFGALCWLTTATRICSGYQTLKRVTTTA